MISVKEADQRYIGLQPVSDYYLTERIGSGNIGIVYKAVRSDPYDELACKVIPADQLKSGWERELEKVVRLRRVPGVVQYHQHGTGLDADHRSYVWTLWDYIPSTNLRDYLDDAANPVDLAFIELVGKTLLSVLHACQSVGITHGDLHAGNILVSDPDSRLPGSPRTIWVSDFGYGGSHNNLQPKDDHRQILALIASLLRRLDPANLNARDREFHSGMWQFAQRRLLECDATQASFVGDTSALLNDFTQLGPAADRDAAAAARGDENQEPGDFLWAEAIGYRREEWRNLFVPQFMASQDLLSKNITVLTGARGCGKTMVFRRLTVYMDEVVGEPSNVPGADQFAGFYLNCRDLVEAFPWLPSKLSDRHQQQIMHYFHLSWFAEVCKTLAIKDNERVPESYQWLDRFAVELCPGYYESLPLGADILAHVMSFIEQEKERCRVTPFGKPGSQTEWPLSRTDFLDRLQTLLDAHVPWVKGRPLCLFLDDYTAPIVPRQVQRVLNTIIFKRRSALFFKISTEAANSLEWVGLRGKILELNQDFGLIDLATESLHQAAEEKRQFLDRVFRPRIDRHPILKGKDLGLRDVLGDMGSSNNGLAWTIRNAVEKGKTKTIRYSGIEAFVGMWTSDVRTAIQMFVDMLRDANGELQQNATQIKAKIQDKVYRAAGGTFLAFAEAVTNPSDAEIAPRGRSSPDSYGRHLIDIAEAFAVVARHELTKGPLVSNEGRKNPRQAFRLEIVDKFNLTPEALAYYEGLVRWHVFLHDWRGKSVRGMLTPRLYMNRVLIPYCQLTFSSHDSISLTNDEFILLLTKPKEFPKYWTQVKRAKKQVSSKQTAFATEDMHEPEGRR